MRPEAEMMALILDVARRDDRVFAVYMNGSRANPTAPKDSLRDYDIVYVVEAVAPFVEDTGWLDVFGERIMMQEPTRLDAARAGRPMELAHGYTYLMLFADGNRIDLTLESVDTMRSLYGKDSLTIPLLDKQRLLKEIAPPTDRSYWGKAPTAGQFEACTSDFWWCAQNVGKGLVRGEFPYARGVLEHVVRSELDQIVVWWVGMQGCFQVNVGKLGKWLPKLLPPDVWGAYADTYHTADGGALWRSLFAMGTLFRRLGTDVAAHMGFAYPEAEDRHMTAYLQGLRSTATQDDDW